MGVRVGVRGACWVCGVWCVVFYMYVCMYSGWCAWDGSSWLTGCTEYILHLLMMGVWGWIGLDWIGLVGEWLTDWLTDWPRVGTYSIISNRIGYGYDTMWRWDMRMGWDEIWIRGYWFYNGCVYYILYVVYYLYVIHLQNEIVIKTIYL